MPTLASTTTIQSRPRTAPPARTEHRPPKFQTRELGRPPLTRPPSTLTHTHTARWSVQLPLGLARHTQHLRRYCRCGGPARVSSWPAEKCPVASAAESVTSVAVRGTRRDAGRHCPQRALFIIFCSANSSVEYRINRVTGGAALVGGDAARWQDSAHSCDQDSQLTSRSVRGHRGRW